MSTLPRTRDGRVPGRLHQAAAHARAESVEATA